MRLWSVHPQYLDPPGLVALWREALLAQAVLLGRTKGYTHHPQLQRFQSTANPPATIGTYLTLVLEEATRRGYNFAAKKIAHRGTRHSLRVTSGQLAYETAHLRHKLSVRSPLFESRLPARCAAHPMFRVGPGPVAAWERAQ